MESLLDVKAFISRLFIHIDHMTTQRMHDGA